MEKLLNKSNKRVLQLAKELSVRELEQVKKGHYIAFVDQQDDCFDLKIVLDKGVVSQMHCDCQGQSTPCEHQLAVLLAIKEQLDQPKAGKAQSKVKKSTAKSPKKLSATQTILQELDKTTLDNWVLEVFKKNKPLEQQFLLSFSQKENNYTPQQVIDITNKVIDSVAGKRKTLEAMKIKKVIDLLKIAIEPIDTYIAININSIVGFEIFTAFLNTIYHFDKRIVHHSKRLGIFVDDYIEKYAIMVNQIQHLESWQSQVQMYIDTIFQGNKRKMEFNYILVQQLYFQANESQRLYFAQYLATRLQEQANVVKSKRIYFTLGFSTFLKQVCKDNEQGESVEKFFAEQYLF